MSKERLVGKTIVVSGGTKGVGRSAVEAFAREGARVKIMLVGCPQTAGRASRSGVGRAFGHRRAF